MVSGTMTDLDAVRDVAVGLPRAYEAVVHGRVKFRVGRIVFLAFSRDETVMGFAFPKMFRDALIESEPEKFLMPPPCDLRYNWVEVRLAAIDGDEMRRIVVDAWAMVVPKREAEAHRAGVHPGGCGPSRGSVQERSNVVRIVGALGQRRTFLSSDPSTARCWTSSQDQGIDYFFTVMVPFATAGVPELAWAVRVAEAVPWLV